MTLPNPFGAAELTYSQVKARLLSKVGVHEDPARTNQQPFGVWYGWNGVPWCMIFQSWGFHDALQQIGGKGASCSLVRARFREVGRYGSTPKVGSLAIFNGAVHVEMVLEVHADYLVTVGGNTTSSTGTNQWGGQVSIKKRYRSSIDGYCYPLYKPAAVTPKPSPLKVISTLHLGSHGTAVRRLQAGLNKIRHTGLATDGRFGPKTLAAVKAYQRAEKISNDGRVGPTTQRHLFSDGVKLT